MELDISHTKILYLNFLDSFYLIPVNIQAAFRLTDYFLGRNAIHCTMVLKASIGNAQAIRC